MKLALVSLSVASIALGVFALTPRSLEPSTLPADSPITTRPADIINDGADWQTLVEFVTSDATPPHVYTVKCGGWGTQGSTTGVSAHGEGWTEEQAKEAALNALLAKLWPSVTHTCDSCANPDKCKKVIYHDDNNGPVVHVGPNFQPSPPFLARAEFSGTYWWACTPCN